jgi:2-iminobutanoate/2-iminopropanoate deaminase
MSSKTAISTDAAPAPAASYSQAVRSGTMLAVAGQVGIDPATGQIVSDDVAEQTRQTLRNVTAVLEAAGASMADVIQLRVFLTDRAHFAAMNEVYAEFVTDPFPARTTVFVGLGAGFLVEIDALAVIE